MQSRRQTRISASTGDYHLPMEIKTDPSRLLMSDALRGRLPEELENEAAETLEQSAVHVIAKFTVGDTGLAVIGLLRTVLFETEPELEFRTTLDDALTVVSAKSLQFQGFQLQYGDRTVDVPGPFLIKGARIDDISVGDQLCVLALGLKRPPRA